MLVPSRVKATVRPEVAVAVGGVGGAADRRRRGVGRGERDRLAALVDGERLLDLGRRVVVAVAGLVGVDNVQVPTAVKLTTPPLREQTPSSCRRP